MTHALLSRAGKTPYGPKSEVPYADPGYQDDGVARYPIDSESHVRSAWSYINQEENASKYTPEQLKKVKGRIRAAMEELGAEVDDDTARSLAVRHGNHNQDSHGRRYKMPGDPSSGLRTAAKKAAEKTAAPESTGPKPAKKAATTKAAGRKATGSAAKGGVDLIPLMREQRLDRPHSQAAQHTLSDANARLRRGDSPADVAEFLRDRAESLAREEDEMDPDDDQAVSEIRQSVGALRRIAGALDKAGGSSTRSRLLTHLQNLLVVRSGPLTYNRSYALDDIQISRSGDGRTVEAYAAIFDSPYEVRDTHGHYMERIDRSAFNRTLNGAGKNAICVYNHGMTLHGTPDGMASLPLGNPLEIKPDGRGLLTITRYNKGPWADSVLESIRNGDIKAQSFRGQIFRSTPTGTVPKRRFGGPLPTVTRHELGLSDYGPTPTAVNDDAAIVAVRSAADIIDAMQLLDADELEELLRHLGIDESTPGLDEVEDPDEDDETEEDLEELEDVIEDDEEDKEETDEEHEHTATSDNSEPGAEDPPAESERSTAGHSGRLELNRALLRMELIRRGVRRGKAA